MKQQIKQISIFAIIGIINTFVDAVFLNVLLIFVGQVGTVGYAVLKAISFTFANINSYILNSRFTFGTSRNYTSFVSFFTATLAGMLVNIGISSLVFFFARSMMNQSLAANIGLVIGTGASMVINFILYKYVVFRKDQTSTQQ